MRLRVRASKSPEQLAEETYELAKTIPLPKGMYTDETEAVVKQIEVNLAKLEPELENPQELAYLRMLQRDLKDFRERVRSGTLTNILVTLDKLWAELK